MGDEFANASDLWALAARLMQRQAEADEDSWEIELSDATMFRMSFFRDAGSASATIMIAEYDYNKGAYRGLDGDAVRREIAAMAETLPGIAGKASP